MSVPRQTDVLVVGGGPVGLVAALEARRAGLRVTVVEARRPPVDKACGEGLLPPARAALARLGVEVPGREFRGIAYADATRPQRRAEALFTRGPGLGVRRTDLSRALAAAAERAGAVLVEARADSTHLGEGVREDGVTLAGWRASWLFAADGLHSPVRRALGLDRPSRRAVRFGLRQHFAVRPWSDLVEVHWSPTAEAYVTPVADDCVGVAVLGAPGPSFGVRLADFPDLRDRLGAAPEASPVRAAGPLRQRSAARVHGRVLLLGDAAGYVDALTGEGLGIGFASARAAVTAVAAGRPESYERAWRRIGRRPRLLTEGLLGVSGWAPTRRLLVPAARHLPAVFAAAVDSLAAPLGDEGQPAQGLAVAHDDRGGPQR